jgi:hypothetical protein
MQAHLRCARHFATSARRRTASEGRKARLSGVDFQPRAAAGQTPDMSERERSGTQLAVGAIIAGPPGAVEPCDVATREGTVRSLGQRRFPPRARGGRS